MVSLVCVVLIEHSSSVADPRHFGTNPDADPGGPKTYGSGTLLHLHHSSQIKSPSHKTVEMKVFLSIF